MKKIKLFTILLLVLTLLCSVFILASCSGGGGYHNGDDPTPTPTPTPSTPTKLTAPTVVLTDDTATWSADASADKFEISIGGELSYIENSVTSKKLTDGQTFKIRAIGDGMNYTNSDWSNSVTYTKPSDPTDPDVKYTIIWKNGDTVLETDTNVAEGTVPTYDGTVPTKASDAQYSYTFSGWTPEVVAANGDVTYTAVFTSTKNKYTVTWKNGDSTLETDENVEYGTLPVYNGTEPQKASDAQYIYVFNGWSPVISEVVGTVTYEAQFASTPNTYTVIWKNGDTVLETDENIPYGSNPSYDDATPIKESTVQYTYAFSGWSPEISAVTESITYTAQFTETVRKYTITFYPEDGHMILDAVSVDYGTAATYSKSAPTKNSTESHTYTFDKWVTTPNGNTEDDLSNVVADRSVYASFKQEVRKVTVNVVSNNTDYGMVSVGVLNNIPYGSSISVNGNTISIDGNTITVLPKSATAQYTYSFVSWTTDETVGNDTTIIANFTRTVNTYTIIWKNGDYTLETDENVEYGVTPVYNGSTPTKPSSAEYNYTFSGWSPSVSIVTGDITYNAQFTDATNKYTVTFYDDDGVTVLGVSVVEYGQNASYPNALPTKAETAQYTYLFDKWVTEKDGSTEALLNNISENKSVYAKYTATTKNYTVTFCDWDGTILDEQSVAYGNAATAPEDLERDGYRFDGWDKSYNNVTQDITVTAKYQAEVEVKFLDYDGSVIYSEYIDQGSNFTNIPENPTRSDYVFTGWSTNAFENIVEDLEVQAQYVRTYRVSFVDYNGTILKTENVMTGTAATAPSDPSREGYDFVGWDTEFSSITSDLRVTARYQIKRYTVTFVMPDGKTVSVQENIKHGFSAKAPAVDEYYFDWNVKKGYKFTNWSTAFDNITSNKTITAIYGTEVTEPIIVVQNTTVAAGTTNVPVRVYICSSEKIYGISLDMLFDNTLQLGGAISVDVRNTFGNMDTDYTSKLTDEGAYELRWTDGDGVDPSVFSGPVPLLTFNFNLYEFQNDGDYLVSILESTYIINEDLVKVTPVVISGTVTLGN